MKKTIVSTIYGLDGGGYNPDYINAKRRKNMGCIARPWPIKSLAIIYHCRVCDKIKKEHKHLNDEYPYW